MAVEPNSTHPRSTTSGNQPLRIGLFSPALPGSGLSNGIVTYVHIMREILRGLGHSVVVATPDHIELADGSVRKLARKPPAIEYFQTIFERVADEERWQAWARLRVLNSFMAARRAGIDVFEIEESFGWAGRLVGRGIPIIERLHGPHVFGREPTESQAERIAGDRREAAELTSFTRVEAVSCPSQRLLDATVAKYHLSLPLARTIPNPVPLAPPNEMWRFDRVDPQQILCVGRFDLRKGADVVLRAFAQALESRPSLRLVMAGPDSGLVQADGTRIHFNAFAAQEFSPNAQARIKFLGSLPANEIKALRMKSAFAIVGSRFENFPYSVAEAMACGMPVLATDSFGNAELLRNGIDGLIVPVGDVEALTRGILVLASQPRLISRMGQSAYRRAAEWLSPERIANETIALYREAITPTIETGQLST